MLGMTCQVSNSDQTLTDCVLQSSPYRQELEEKQTSVTESFLTLCLSVQFIKMENGDHLTSSPGDINSECSLILSSINDIEF